MKIFIFFGYYITKTFSHKLKSLFHQTRLFFRSILTRIPDCRVHWELSDELTVTEPVVVESQKSRLRLFYKRFGISPDNSLVYSSNRLSWNTNLTYIFLYDWSDTVNVKGTWPTRGGQYPSRVLGPVRARKDTLRGFLNQGVNPCRC